jgi:hypothetical protein
MGREIRRVHKDWQHPTTESGDDIPLHVPTKPIEEMQADWDREEAEWCAGTHPDFVKGREDTSFEEWNGSRPKAERFMPWWAEDERTHWQMYEDTSEGTPISPVLESREAVAKWCADNGASYFASEPATYERWLDVANGGFGGLVFILPTEVSQ